MPCYVRARKMEYVSIWRPGGIDQPSSITEQLRWLEQVGFQAVDVYWMGHVILGRKNVDNRLKPGCSQHLPESDG